MAGVHDCFGIGSTVYCKTRYKKEYEGEVQAFDPQTKMLILKCPATNGRPSCSNVHVINLAHVSDVQVKQEGTMMPEAPKPLNLARLNMRARNNIEEKQRLINALRVGVSPEGQKLFLTISRTIGDVSWQGDNILVLKTVTITPPYLLENVRGNPDSKALNHIRKVVDKHTKDQAQAAHGMSGDVSSTSNQNSSNSSQ